GRHVTHRERQPALESLFSPPHHPAIDDYDGIVRLPAGLWARRCHGLRLWSVPRLADPVVAALRAAGACDGLRHRALGIGARFDLSGCTALRRLCAAARPLYIAGDVSAYGGARSLADALYAQPADRVDPRVSLVDVRRDRAAGAVCGLLGSRTCDGNAGERPHGVRPARTARGRSHLTDECRHGAP